MRQGAGLTAITARGAAPSASRGSRVGVGMLDVMEAECGLKTKPAEGEWDLTPRLHEQQVLAEVGQCEQLPQGPADPEVLFHHQGQEAAPFPGNDEGVTPAVLRFNGAWS